MSQDNERRARELLMRLVPPRNTAKFIDETRVAYLAAALDEAEARGRPQWTRVHYDTPETLPPGGIQCLMVVNWGDGRPPGVARGQWDPEHERWDDDEEDGMGSRLEWAPGYITHWAPWPEPPSPTTEEQKR